MPHARHGMTPFRHIFTSAFNVLLPLTPITRRVSGNSAYSSLTTYTGCDICLHSVFAIITGRTIPPPATVLHAGATMRDAVYRLVSNSLTDHSTANFFSDTNRRRPLILVCQSTYSLPYVIRGSRRLPAIRLPPVSLPYEPFCYLTPPAYLSPRDTRLQYAEHPVFIKPGAPLVLLFSPLTARRAAMFRALNHYHCSSSSTNISSILVLMTCNSLTVGNAVATRLLRLDI